MSRAGMEGFLEELRARLGARPDRERILGEMRDHMEEAARRLLTEGRSDAEAVKLAVAGMGTPEQIAQAFANESPSSSPEMVRLLAALAAITSTTGLLILGHSLSPPEIHEASLPLLLFKVLGSAATTGIGALVLLPWRRASPPAVAARWAGLLLTLLGLTTLPIVLRLGSVSGDYELWAFALGLIQAAQGLLIIYVFGRTPRFCGPFQPVR